MSTCQTIIWISVLAGWLWVFANQASEIPAALATYS